MKYVFYKWLQNYVHRDYCREKDIIRRAFAAHLAWKRPNYATALELGCGDGNMAGIIPPEAYLGIDLAVDRVAAAKNENPQYRFEVCNVNSPGFRDLLRQFDFIFCLGLLHHLNDNNCRELLREIETLTPKPATFIAIEPLLPAPYANPPGFLMAKLDAGKHIRAPEVYRQMFADRLIQVEYINFWPRWPVQMEAYTLRYV